MQLVEKVQKVEYIGIEKPHMFNVEVGPKLFKTLIKNLYTDPIRALIRELSTNAWEIHKQLGKETTPFTVKLPNWTDSTFKIRDYGTGLSPEEIKKVYTVIFKSTKDDSNELGGCYGLGSKSPYAYSGSFVVNSYYQGSKYIYFFVSDQYGSPSYSLASKVATTEPDGVEIVIDVKKEDHHEFSNKARDIYRWFENKPTVTGNSAFSHQIDGKPILEGKGWKYYQVNTYGTNRRPIAVMANVAYDLSAYPDSKKYLLDGMVLFCDIGEITPNPSRESVSFDTHTIASIKKRLDDIEKTISVEAQKEIDTSAHYWEAYLKLSNLSYIFGLASGNLTYKGEKLESPIHPPKGEHLTIIKGKKRNYFDIHQYMSINGNLKFYVDDLVKGGITRIVNALSSKYNWAYYVKSADLAAFKKHYRLDDSQFTYASTLPEPPKVVRTKATNKHLTKVLKLTASSYNAGNCWTDCEVDLEKDSGLYLEIKNNWIVHNGKTVHPERLYEISKHMKQDIYGVKTISLKKLGNGWECAVPKIEKEIKDYVKNNASAVDDDLTNRIVGGISTYFIHHVKALKLSTNELTTVVDEIEALGKKVNKTATIRTNLVNFQRFLRDILGVAEYNGKKDDAFIKKVNLTVEKYKLLTNYFDKDSVEELRYYVLRILEKGR